VPFWLWILWLASDRWDVFVVLQGGAEEETAATQYITYQHSQQQRFSYKPCNYHWYQVCTSGTKQY
jgi:hypothetical protein